MLTTNIIALCIKCVKKNKTVNSAALDDGCWICIASLTCTFKTVAVI